LSERSRRWMRNNKRGLERYRNRMRRNEIRTNINDKKKKKNLDMQKNVMRSL
jgi:hypothetical protein